MADDNEQVDDQIEDAVEDGQIDGGDDDKAQSDSEFVDDTIDFIKDAQKAVRGDEDSDEDGSVASDDSDSAIKELAGTDIPDVFSDAAEAAGMTPSEIIAFADKHTDEDLIDMASNIEAALKKMDEKQDDDKDDKKEDKQDIKIDGKEVDPELIKSITEKISKQLEEKLGTTIEEIDKFKAYQEEQSSKQMVDRASKILDEASKEFPIFGKADELPTFPSGRLKGQVITTSPQWKARMEVLRYADAFMAKGADIDDAMGNALATYKGLHLEKELERKQVRDLKKHETRLSGKRVGKEVKKKYTDSREEIIDDIRQMQRAAGVD